MTYACPAWGFAADTHLSNVQRPAKQGAPHYGNFSRHTPTRKGHVAFKISYVHGFFTKLRRRRAEDTQKHDNKNIFVTLDKAKPQHTEYNKLNLDGGQKYDSPGVYKLPLYYSLMA
jgi:hypothetical protein